MEDSWLRMEVACAVEVGASWLAAELSVVADGLAGRMDWSWSVARMHSGIVAEAVLEHVGDRSLVRAVRSRHVWTGAGGDHVNRQEDLTDFLLSIVVNWNPILEVSMS